MLRRVGIRIVVVAALLMLHVGCASPRSSAAPPATPEKTSAAPVAGNFDDRYPILIHKTGGFAGVDQRYVIWPDGYLEAHDVRGGAFVAGEMDEQTLGLLRGRLR